MGHSYSFLDVQASIYGPGGNVSLAGDEAGVEQGGITVTPAGERSKMTVGADGSVMHSLLGDKSGTVSVKLLKTSSVNAALQIMYNLQTTTGAQHGMNTIVIRDVARGDVITCQNWPCQTTRHHLRHRCRGCRWFNAGSISFLLGM
ncbi:MAG: phage protein [Bilophila wadsworthia]